MLAADASVIVRRVEPVVPVPVKLIGWLALHVAPVGSPLQVNELIWPLKLLTAAAETESVPVELPDAMVTEGLAADR